jgi:hypothetical protein
MSLFTISRNLPRFRRRRPTWSFMPKFWLLILGASLVAAMPALANDVPLPRPRPPEADRKVPQPIAVNAAEIDAAKKDCEAFFKADVAEAAYVDPIAWDNGCLAAAPVSVHAIKLVNGKRIELKPAAILRCPMGLAVAHWVRDSLQPSALKIGAEIERIDVAASYSCRPRNNILGAILSEHGKANALDIRSLHLSNGTNFVIEKAQAKREFLIEMRKSACARFMTVLGPGSDKPHETHLHVDLQQRRNNYKICQWILPPQPGETSAHVSGVGIELKHSGKKAEKNR